MQALYETRLDDDLLKGIFAFFRADPRQIVEEKPVVGGEHGMIERVHIRAHVRFPSFPYRRCALFEHIAPAGIFLVQKQAAKFLRVPRLGEAVKEMPVSLISARGMIPARAQIFRGALCPFFAKFRLFGKNRHRHGAFRLRAAADYAVFDVLFEKRALALREKRVLVFS